MDLRKFVDDYSNRAVNYENIKLRYENCSRRNQAIFEKSPLSKKTIIIQKGLKKYRKNMSVVWI